MMACLMIALFDIDFGWMKSSYHTAANEVKCENKLFIYATNIIMPYSRMISGNFKASLLIICHFKTFIFENFKLNLYHCMAHAREK